MQFDVAVIGGGPAGSSAAITAARAGLRVLLVEKGPYGRDKVCGDGLTPRAIAALDELKIDHSVAHRIDGLRMIAGKTQRELAWPTTSRFPNHGAVWPRQKFDNHLLDIAIASGAEVRFESEALPVLEGDRVVGVQVGSEVFKSSLVVLATGAQGAAAKMLGAVRDPDETFGLAIRAYAPTPRHAERHLEACLSLRDEHGTPALDTAKSVLLALAIRSFSKPELDYTICADESIKQLGEHLGLDQSDSKTKGKDAISNALRFLEWFGGLRTLRKGGGKLKKPTVREVIPHALLSKREVTRSESELSDDLNGNESDLNGREPDLNGKALHLNGKDSELIGSEPVTPSSYQVITKTPPYINHESEIEISNEEYEDYLSQLENSKNFALEEVKKLGRGKFQEPARNRFDSGEDRF